MSDMRKDAPLIAFVTLAVGVVGNPNARTVRAQSVTGRTPKFEVASIKRCRADDISSGGRGGGEGTTKWSPGRLDVRCQSVEDLVGTAYLEYADGKPWPDRVHPPISILASLSTKGAPAWSRSDRYTIEAKAEGVPSMEMTKGPMLQALLEDRFKLKVHRETRRVPVYILTVAKHGPKFHVAREGSCVTVDSEHPRPRLPRPGQTLPTVSSMPCGLFIPSGKNDAGVDSNGTTMAQLCGNLSMLFKRDVVDKTALTGRFDIHFDFDIHQEPGTTDDTGLSTQDHPPHRPTDAELPAIRAMFQMALLKVGLKLDLSKGAAEFLVIDHVERPTEN